MAKGSAGKGGGRGKGPNIGKGASKGGNPNYSTKGANFNQAGRGRGNAPPRGGKKG